MILLASKEFSFHSLLRQDSPRTQFGQKLYATQLVDSNTAEPIMVRTHQAFTAEGYYQGDMPEVTSIDRALMPEAVM